MKRPLGRTVYEWLVLLSATALIMASSACSTMPDFKPDAAAAKDIHNALAGSAPPNRPQAPVSTRVTIPGAHGDTTVVAPVPSAQSRQSAFDLTVEDAPVRQVLMSLVKGTRHNMIVHPSVQGTVSLTLKAVTIDEVLQTLRNVYGYEYRHTSIGYEVLAYGMQTRLFKVDYLNVKRSGESQVRVSSGQLTENNNNNAGGTGGAQQDNSAATGSASRGNLSGSQVNTRSVSDFWLDLQTTLQAVVGDEQGRKVVVNAQTGIVVVRAMPGELRDVEDYLNTIQGTIQRQVILEAKIVEVELNAGFQSGINWAAFARSGSNSANIGQVGGGTVFDGQGLSEIAGSELNLGGLSGLEGLSSSAFGGVFTLAIGANDFTAFIEALQSQGNVHVLSSPRVSTVNNQKAVIKVGSDEFFVTGIQTETTEVNNSLNRSVDVELTPFFSGVALDVIPQINDSGEVTLHVHPSVSEVTEKTKEIQVSTGSSGTLKIPLALSTIRESDSIIRAHSGQVVVIGGLMQTIIRNNEAGVPYLSQVPILGGLFRHQRQVNVKSELVILLRPIVVDRHGVWGEYLQGTRGQFDHLTQYPGAAAETGYDGAQLPRK